MGKTWEEVSALIAERASARAAREAAALAEGKPLPPSKKKAPGFGRVGKPKVKVGPAVKRKRKGLPPKPRKRRAQQTISAMAKEKGWY